MYQSKPIHKSQIFCKCSTFIAIYYYLQSFLNKSNDAKIANSIKKNEKNSENLLYKQKLKQKIKRKKEIETYIHLFSKIFFWLHIADESGQSLQYDGFYF